MSKIVNHKLLTSSDRMNFFVVCGFVLTTFVLGGSSRGDMMSLVLLRPVAFGAMAYALVNGAWEKSTNFKPLLWMLLALAGCMILQLLPMPTYLWSELPGKADIAIIGEEIGLGQLWRPLTLSPSRTLNSLMSLSVPAAMIMLISILRPQYRQKLLIVIACMAIASTIIGIFQQSLAPNKILYFYQYTNIGSAVGLFANRNHHSMFLAALLPIMIMLIRQSVRSNQRDLSLVISTISLICIIMMLPIIGSRAGLLLGVVACFVSVMVVMYFDLGRGAKKHHSFKLTLRTAWWMLAGLMVSCVLVALVISDRATSIERLFSPSPQDNARQQLTPYVLRLVSDYFPFGSGFGTFDLAFYAYEPISSLNQPYLNHAHNDWLQIVAEGGIVGVGLVLAFSILIVRSMAEGWQSRRANAEAWTLRCAAFAAISVLALASLPDYPLRVPSIMIFFALLASIVVAPTMWLSSAYAKQGRALNFGHPKSMRDKA